MSIPGMALKETWRFNPFESIRDLILGEDVCRQNAREASNNILRIEDRGMGSNRRCGVVEDKNREGEVDRTS